MSLPSVAFKCFKLAVWLAVSLALLAVVLATVARSAQRQVEAQCAQHTAGQPFSAGERLSRVNDQHYSYQEISGFVEAWHCDVYLDEQGRVLRAQVSAPNGEPEP